MAMVFLIKRSVLKGTDPGGYQAFVEEIILL